MENLQLCLHDPAQFCGRGIPVIHADTSTATGDHLMCPYADAALHGASHGSPFLHNDVSSEVLSVVQPEHNKQSSTFSLLHTDHHHCLYTFYMHRILVFVKYFDVESCTNYINKIIFHPFAPEETRLFIDLPYHQ